ncbi:globin domain-containing protein [Neobacillus sp. Marseille-QA0830]
MTIALEQEKVNELVDRFYKKLLNDFYYVSIFKERGVDIEQLKERQRMFINRLVSEDASEGNETHVSQVKERHPFKIAPERAENWFYTMKETIDEMDLDVSVKKQLKEKI